MIPVNGLVTIEGQCGGCGGSGLSPTYGFWNECAYCIGMGGWFEIVHVTSLDETLLYSPNWFDEDKSIVDGEIIRRLINEVE